jgi:hypothetical protein
LEDQCRIERSKSKSVKVDGENRDFIRLLREDGRRYVSIIASESIGTTFQPNHRETHIAKSKSRLATGVWLILLQINGVCHLVALSPKDELGELTNETTQTTEATSKTELHTAGEFTTIFSDFDQYG